MGVVMTPNREGPRVHLRGPRWRTNNRRAACGLEAPKRHTSNPREVTCQHCARTVQMGDAEILAQRKR